MKTLLLLTMLVTMFGCCKKDKLPPGAIVIPAGVKYGLIDNGQLVTVGDGSFPPGRPEVDVVPANFVKCPTERGTVTMPLDGLSFLLKNPETKFTGKIEVYGKDPGRMVKISHYKCEEPF